MDTGKRKKKKKKEAPPEPSTPSALAAMSSAAFSKNDLALSLAKAASVGVVEEAGCPRVNQAFYEQSDELNVIMIRFLGTSRSSSNARQLLISLCGQLTSIFSGNRDRHFTVPERFSVLCDLFGGLLVSASEKLGESGRSLYLIRATQPRI